MLRGDNARWALCCAWLRAGGAGVADAGPAGAALSTMMGARRPTYRPAPARHSSAPAPNRR